MPRAQPGERFGGREKGTPNKSTQDIRAVADAVASRAGGWESLFEKFVTSKDPDISFKATQLLAAYRYGKPKETHEVVGEGGGPVRVKVEIVKRGSV